MSSFIKKAIKVCIGGALFLGGMELGSVFAKGHVLGVMQKTGLNANEMLQRLEEIDKTKMQKMRVYLIKDVAQWLSKTES